MTPPYRWRVFNLQTPIYRSDMGKRMLRQRVLPEFFYIRMG